MHHAASTHAQDTLFFAFFIFWICLGIAGYVFFHHSKDVAKKRYWFPRFGIFTGVLFLAFAWVMMSLGPPGQTLAPMTIMVPAVILIIYLNIRMVRFCDQCSHIVYTRGVFTAPKFCSFCGAKLDEKTPASPNS